MLTEGKGTDPNMLYKTSYYFRVCVYVYIYVCKCVCVSVYTHTIPWYI